MCPDLRQTNVSCATWPVNLSPGGAGSQVMSGSDEATSSVSRPASSSAGDTVWRAVCGAGQGSLSCLLTCCHLPMDVWEGSEGGSSRRGEGLVFIVWQKLLVWGPLYILPFDRQDIWKQWFQVVYVRGRGEDGLAQRYLGRILSRIQFNKKLWHNIVRFISHNTSFA